jgi:glyoxylase-like metal-dependent hydrolase (beta-lactamase superfamily II)
MPETLMELVRIADDVHLFRSGGHVAMFITTSEGVILCDPCGQTNKRTPFVLKEAIRAVSDQPVRYVVYSHWGADHGEGGAAFADTAEFVGHKQTVAKIAAANDPASPPPTIVFDQPTALELGGKRVDLIPADLSDTDDYVILHYAPAKVVMLVDLVQPQSAPFRDLLGHPDTTIERFQWIDDNLDFDVIVSGHTQPHMLPTRTDLREQRQYLLDLSDAIETARAAGHADASPEMLSATRALMEPKYGAWRRFDQFFNANVEGMIGWRSGRNMRTT